MSTKETQPIVESHKVGNEDLFKSLKDVSYEELRTWATLPAVLERRTNRDRTFTSYSLSLNVHPKLQLTNQVKADDYFLFQLRFDIPDSVDRKVFPNVYCRFVKGETVKDDGTKHEYVLVQAVFANNPTLFAYSFFINGPKRAIFDMLIAKGMLKEPKWVIKNNLSLNEENPSLDDYFK